MIYKYQTEGRSLKDFSYYQNSIDLLRNLRYSNVNPREVLKNQTDCKSDLGQIKTKSKIKIRRSNKCNTKCSKFLWFKRKNY